jgi:ribokinase
VFQEALAQIDILAVNRQEAETLVPGLVARFGEGGRALPLERGEKPPRLLVRGLVGGGHEMALAAFFDALRQMGPRFVLVTDGRHGAFLGTREAIHFCPVRETTLAGTAGAGDAFNSTFTAYIAFGSKPEDALRAAAVNAASVVGHVDTQTGLLSRDAIAKALAATGDELPVRSWSLKAVAPQA